MFQTQKLEIHVSNNRIFGNPLKFLVRVTFFEKIFTLDQQWGAEPSGN